MDSLRIISRLLCVLLVVNQLSCQTKSNEKATETADIKQVDSTVLLTIRPGRDAPRSAADRLVRALYFEHNKTENPFRETKDRSLVDQFFAKPTANLIWNSKNPVKANLLFNAPEQAVKKMWVEPAAVGGSRAVVYTTFENKGRPEEIKINLQQFAGRWRITDMLYPNGKQLTELLK